MTARQGSKTIREYCRRQGVQATVQGKTIGFDGVKKAFVEVTSQEPLDNMHLGNILGIAKNSGVMLTFKVPGRVDG